MYLPGPGRSATTGELTDASNLQFIGETVKRTGTVQVGAQDTVQWREVYDAEGREQAGGA